MATHFISVDEMVTDERPPKYILFGSIIVVIGCKWLDRDIDLTGWDTNLLTGHDLESFRMLCSLDRLQVKEVHDDDVLFRDVTLKSFLAPLEQSK